MKAKIHTKKNIKCSLSQEVEFNGSLNPSENINAQTEKSENICANSTQRGAQGIPGKDGEAATIELGTVSTGAAGTDVVITNSGTSSAAIFNFTIPRGAHGEQGTAGEIVGATATVDNNIGIPSVSVISGGTSTERTFDFAFYNLKGETGSAGADGQDGQDGQDGFSPIASVTQTATGATLTVIDAEGTTTATILNGTNGTDGTAATISVGTVSTGAAGTSATVVNSGTSSEAVFDFVIPQGAKGDTGSAGAAGTDGFSPLATVTSTATGATISITDKNGTTTANITNGVDGTDGTDGTNATITGVTASVDSNVGTPSVSVTVGGTESARTFDFAFHNLKGASGSGTGTVNSVNNILPDGGGNVTLTASDVGALSSTTTIGAGTTTITVNNTSVGSINANATSDSSININALQNTATGNNSLTIGGNATNYATAINIGYNSSAFSEGVAIGNYARTTYTGCTAIGKNTLAGGIGSRTTALGYGAEAINASDCIQIGYGTNSTSKSLSIGFYNSESTHYNWQLLDGATGLIPDARLSSNIARTSQIPTVPTNISAFTNDSGYITGITSSDVTTALGYTPYNSSNPNGYTSNVGTVTSVNNTNPDSNGNVTLNIDALPSQTGNAGKVLTTDGTDASWGATTEVYPVIETYSNNASWYRIYAPDSTGYRWCEMGSFNYVGSTLASTDNTITFLKTFQDLNYNFVAIPMHSTANINSYSAYEKYESRTTTTTVLRTVGAVFGYEWRACGYIANEV